MKKVVSIIVVALAVVALNTRAQETNNPPPAGGPGRGPGGFHILPPRAQEQLNLTADQQKQLKDLEAEIKAKIETILTSAQMEQLKQMRPPQRAGGTPNGGPGGPQSGSASAPSSQPHLPPDNGQN